MATAAVLCTDLVDSTALLTRLGEADFDAFRRRHFALLRADLAAHGGQEIKTLGEGILAVFTSAADALSCAVALQQSVDRPTTPRRYGVAIGIGLAVGEVSWEDGDLFGTPVVQAARLAGAARGGQILTTELVRALAGGRARAQCVDLGPMRLKGLPEPVGVCEVRWEGSAGSAAVELRLLGPVDIVVDGAAIGIGSAKQRAVLAVLALRPATVVSADALVDAVWGQSPPPSAASTLRSLVSRLRRTVAEAGIAEVIRLHGKDSGYLLEVDACVVDVHRFDAFRASAAAATRLGQHAAAAADLETGLTLWHGPALGESGDTDRIAVEARRLEEGRRLAVEELATAALESGRAEFALAQASALVAAHPMRERGWGLVMLAAYRAGRQADALEAYRQLRRVLAEELGIEPMPALRELHERILRQDPLLAPAGGLPEVRAAEVTAPHNIPVALTSFVGRSAELAELGPMVAGARMVTLSGVGGAGKTRLALAWAARAAAAYPGGARVAELAPIRDPALVTAAVAGAIGFLPGELTSGGRPLADALCAQLRERRLLLVLDNCEHLVASVAELCVAMLSRCPALTIVATSREVLGVPGELVYPVPPLSLPARGAAAETIDGSDAGRLFCERARAVEPRFTLTTANCAAVLEICRRLDGIPLALELAAARMRILSPAQIAERLGAKLSLLAATGRHTVARHQTLRAAIDWSYELLPLSEQAVLARLSVFPGTFDLAGADAVNAVGDAGSYVGYGSLDLLTRLVDKSLVTVTRDEQETRFALLETVREYAAEKLVEAGELATVRDRHRDCYLRAALASTRDMSTFSTRLRVVGRELDNYRAALRWSVQHGDAAAVLALSAFAFPHWVVVASDDEGWLEHAVAAPAHLGPAAAAEVRCALAMLTRDRGGSAQRVASLREESLRIARACGDLDTLGRVSVWFSELELGAGNLDRANELRDAARAAFTSLGSRLGQAWCEHQLALIRLAENDVAEAARHLDVVLALVGPDNDEWFAPHAYGTRALVAALSGDPGSNALADEGLRVARGFPWPVLLAMSLTRATQAAVLSKDQDQDRARRLLLDELLPLLRDLGFHRWVADGLELSALTLAQSAPQSAISVLGSSSALRNRLGEAQGGGTSVLARRIDACRVTLMEAVGAHHYAQHDRQGRVMTTDEALAFAHTCLQDGGNSGG
jgi:predicted ATPase/DNA-binding SARP family transcriptional activator